MDRERVKTRDALAKRLGVSRPSLRDYLRAGMPGPDADGWFDVELCREWLVAHRVTLRGAGGADRPGDDELRRAKLRAEVRKLRADARAKELRNRETQGQLVYINDVTADFCEWLVRAKAILEALPDDLAKELPDDLRVSIHNQAGHAVRRTLHLLASWPPAQSKDGQ